MLSGLDGYDQDELQELIQDLEAKDVDTSIDSQSSFHSLSPHLLVENSTSLPSLSTNVFSLPSQLSVNAPAFSPSGQHHTHSSFSFATSPTNSSFSSFSSTLLGGPSVMTPAFSSTLTSLSTHTLPSLTSSSTPSTLTQTSSLLTSTASIFVPTHSHSAHNTTPLMDGSEQKESISLEHSSFQSNTIQNNHLTNHMQLNNSQQNTDSTHPSINNASVLLDQLSLQNRPIVAPIPLAIHTPQVHHLEEEEKLKHHLSWILDDLDHEADGDVAKKTTLNAQTNNPAHNGIHMSNHNIGTATTPNTTTNNSSAPLLSWQAATANNPLIGSTRTTWTNLNGHQSPELTTNSNITINNSNTNNNPLLGNALLPSPNLSAPLLPSYLANVLPVNRKSSKLSPFAPAFTPKDIPSFTPKEGLHQHSPSPTQNVSMYPFSSSNHNITMTSTMTNLANPNSNTFAARHRSKSSTSNMNGNGNNTSGDQSNSPTKMVNVALNDPSFPPLPSASTATTTNNSSGNNGYITQSSVTQTGANTINPTGVNITTSNKLVNSWSAAAILSNTTAANKIHSSNNNSPSPTPMLNNAPTNDSIYASSNQPPITAAARLAAAMAASAASNPPKPAVTVSKGAQQSYITSMENEQKSNDIANNSNITSPPSDFSATSTSTATSIPTTATTQPSSKKPASTDNTKNKKNKGKQSDSWVCSSCTFENFLAQYFCEMCETERPKA